ncbi:hypothetical protein PJE062_2971 [Pseudovibrio sp. JE062]|nr:hypothetical protein PJE062_2971 [Pseudovibrio sp. JE062]
MYELSDALSKGALLPLERHRQNENLGSSLILSVLVGIS